MPRVLALLLALLVLVSAGLPRAASAGAHEDLCAALTGANVSAGRVDRALAAGALPDDPCPVTQREMRLRMAGLALLLATGGAAAVVPGWLGPRAWEEHTEVVPFPPLALASQRRSRRGVELLLEAGAAPGGLEGEFALAVVQGELAWAEFLTGTPADRRVGELPRAVLTPTQLDRLLALEPRLASAEFEWLEVSGRFDAHPEMVDALLAAGLPHDALRGAFQVAVDEDRLAFAAALHRSGVPRRLWQIPPSVLSDTDRLERLVAFQPDLERLILLESTLLDAGRRNPELLRQLERAGLDPTKLGRQALRAHDLEAIGLLVELGLDPNREPRDAWELSLLAMAARQGDRPAVELLLRLGARVGPDGDRNAVREAARSGATELAVLLVEQGADPSLQPALWQAIVEEGMERRQPAMLEAALAAGRGRGLPGLEERAVEAIDRYQPELLGPLVAGAEDPVRVATAGLGRAAQYGRPDDVRLALSLGADPDRGTEPDGDSALHRAVSGWRYYQAETVDALIEGGADPELRDRQGRRAIERAIDERCWSAVAPLVAAGARVEASMVERTLAEGWYDRERTAAAQVLLEAGPEAPRRTWRKLLRQARKDRLDPALIRSLETALARR
jgi:ankyrin repeat protein